jgi:nicotinic acid phosphoribosyltransferase
MYNPLLLIDFYKACHAEQYPAGMTKIYSPGTPRLSRLPDVDEVVYIGGQSFSKEYLIKAFTEAFFSLSEEEVVHQYKRIMMNTLTPDENRADKIRALHQLGYLPIALYTVPEGMATAIGVPQSCFVNTHPDFAWLTNTLETLYSSYIWHIQIAAEVGKRYRKIVDKYVAETCDPDVRAARMLGDFSMRGQHCDQSAMKASAAWLLSFLNTATVPAIMWLEDNYNCDCEKEEVGYGALSFEHSTVTSNYAIDGDEETLLKRALTEIYPNSNFSFLTDSYDHDNFLLNVVPKCKDEILAHNGTILFRGDSGDPVEIMAGKDIQWFRDEYFLDDFSEDEVEDWFRDWARDNDIEEEGTYYFNINDKFYSVFISPEYIKERGGYSDSNYYFLDDYTITWRQVEPSLELLGMIWYLDQVFGSTINSKGYKVLNSHVKGIYGDSMTPSRVEEAYKRLRFQGYAINNVVFGVGSFSFMCLEDADGKMNPYTRDTFGYAIKATYGEDKDGNPVMIYKQPKALAWKKSPKGCIIVASDGKSYTDGHTFEEAHGEGVENLLQLVFKDGKMVKETSLAEIRNRMYPEGF